MKSIKKVLSFAVLFVFASVFNAAGKESLKINLDQPTKTDRKGLPVFGGLPFAKGALLKIDNLRLLDNSGKEQPLQARALSLWPDGSVKSAMLDFQYNIPLDKDTTAVLEYGSGVKGAPRATGLQIKKNGAKITVDTGVMQCFFSKSGAGFIDEVTVDGKVIGTGINFARFKGDTAPNKVKVSSVEVEEGGDIQNPLRAVVKVEGIYEGHLQTSFILRVHLYAGKSFVKVFHTFIYAGNRQNTEDHMVELEVGVELAGGVKNILYGIDGEAPVEPKAVKGSSFLFSKTDIEYEISGIAPKPLPSGKPAGWWMETKGKPAGWMSVSGDKGSLQLGIRDMWQNYPKGLRVDGNKATLVLWPKEHAPFDLKTNARFFENSGDSGVWNDSTPELEKGSVSGTHSSSGKGSSKTHELYFNFMAPAEQNALNASFLGFQEPTYMYAGGKWYPDTKIFDLFNPAGQQYQDSNLKRHDILLELNARWLLFIQKYWRWYGMWDYGDLIHCGPTTPNSKHPDSRYPIGPKPPLEHGRWDVAQKFKQNWAANCHYDIIQAVSLHFMRTGKREYYRFAEVLAQHANEVDSMYPSNAKDADAPEAEKKIDAGDETAGEGGKNLFGFTSRHGCGHGQVSASHQFMRWRLPMYLLSGNERFRYSAGIAFESALKNAPKEFFTGNSIRPTSAVTKTMETWFSISGDSRAEKESKYLLDYWLSRQQTKGDYGAYVGINKTYGRVKGNSNEVFDAYKVMSKKKVEVTDPNSWEFGETGGWRFMNFGATEAMMDWYNLTGDKKIGDSVVRFLRATMIYGTTYRWYKSHQHLAFAWRITKDEMFREWLRTEQSWVFNKNGEFSKPETTVELKDNMKWEDFSREFKKYYTKDHYSQMSPEDAASRLLLNPYAMYTFEPYDKSFPPAISTGGTQKGKKSNDKSKGKKKKN
jgi:hypothetical protein